jgi:unsaturated rhamnogalacturonyl hydrolase
VKPPFSGYRRLLPCLILACARWSRADASVEPGTTPASILSTLERAADWQLAHPSRHDATDWTQGAGSAGMMALAGISGNAAYRDAMRVVGESSQWQLGPKFYDADDHCIGQTYAELYLLFREKGMIAPLRARFDAILAAPSRVHRLDFRNPSGDSRENWSWCDSLFMGPPTWARLYAATGDTRYLDFAVSNWWRTTDFLYDREEHLFFRDSTYFSKREANGRKVFWSRGNGWVMAGLVRTLQFLPSNHPDATRFGALFREMAGKVLSCQQPDGLWRASLLDPGSYPLKETSGSGFYVYALAWGVNQGLLDRSTYEPALRRGWRALADCVDGDGKLTHVQPIGADPRQFSDDSTEVYGVGAFLLAGSEMYRMAVLEKAAVHKVEATVANPASFRRESETIEMDLGGGVSPLPTATTPATFRWPAARPVVMDGESSRILDSQVCAAEGGSGPDTLLFQVDLAPNETRRFSIIDASALAAQPPPIVKTYVRQVPERFNDMAWENDRTAHRNYQQALIKGEGTVSSGIDVWSKRTRSLIVDEWYKRGDYHNDHGDGMDDYHVGRSRGCGGLGIWDGKNLHVAVNFRGARILTTGPIRSEFELTYDAWDVAGRNVSEVRRIRIDAGSNVCRASSLFSSGDRSPLTVGIGIAQRPGNGASLACDQEDGWMTYWQAPDRDRGSIGCAVLVPGGVLRFVSERGSLPSTAGPVPAVPGVEGLPPAGNELALARAEVGRPFVYYFGAGWSKSGDFADEKDWENYVRLYDERLKAPVRVDFGAD